MSQNAEVLRQFLERVWNEGDSTAVDQFVAESYTIHSDPGDPWDGKTLNRDVYRQRLVESRGPFPDLRFELGEIIEEGDRVAICWTMRGTHKGPLAGRPATGRSICAQGMTVYYFSAGRLLGHRQVVDRMTVAGQLGLFG